MPDCHLTQIDVPDSDWTNVRVVELGAASPVSRCVLSACPASTWLCCGSLTALPYALLSLSCTVLCLSCAYHPAEGCIGDAPVGQKRHSSSFRQYCRHVDGQIQATRAFTTLAMLTSSAALLLGAISCMRNAATALVSVQRFCIYLSGTLQRSNCGSSLPALCHLVQHVRAPHPASVSKLALGRRAVLVL